MATGTVGFERQELTEGTKAASRKDRIALTLFGLLAAYSVVYLLLLATKFQV